MGVIAVLLSAVGTFLFVVFASAVANQAAHEFRGWAPWVTERLIQRAVQKAPEQLRARLREEWTALIRDTPGHILQIIRALHLNRAAARIAIERSNLPLSSSERVFSRVMGVLLYVSIFPTFLLARCPMPAGLSPLMQEFRGSESMLKRMINGELVLSWAKRNTSHEAELPRAISMVSGL